MNLNPLKKQVATPPPRSPEREELAEAIATRDHFAREVEADEKALEILRDQRRDGGTSKAVWAAKAAVETAKENAAKYLTDSAMGVASQPPLSIKDARAALQQAEDDFETSETAFESLKAKQESDKDKLKWWKDRVRDRVSDVVSAESDLLRKLVADFNELQRRVAGKHLILSFLTTHMPRGMSWSDVRQYSSEELLDLDETGPWRAALAELESNPDATLPTV